MKWKSLFCLPLLALLLLACGGCQPKSAILLQGKELVSWEDLYGQDIDAVAGTLGVELSYSEVRNVWNLPEPVLFEEMEFTRQLLFEADTNTLFGVRYVYQGPVEDLSSFVDGLLSQFTKAYGQAITYPETKYRLSDDAFKAAAAASLDQWEMFLYPWREEWSASENTVCCLSVQPIPGRTEIILDYTMASEEPVFHIQGDYPDFIRIQRNHIADEDYKDFSPRTRSIRRSLNFSTDFSTAARKSWNWRAVVEASCTLWNLCTKKTIPMRKTKTLPLIVASVMNSPTRISWLTMSCITVTRRLWPSCRRIWGHDF